MADPTNGLSVLCDETTLKIDSSTNKLCVNIDNSTIKYDATSGHIYAVDQDPISTGKIKSNDTITVSATDGIMVKL